MRECPDTDAIVVISDALDWDVLEGLQHLQACAECRARLQTLQAARAALLEVEPVESAVLARISQSLSAAARDEQKRAHRSQRWASAAEAVLAAVGAPIVLVSSGVQIGSVAAGLLTCVLGATLLVYGRRLNLWRHP